MGEEEAQVECGVACVRAFKIEQNEAVVMHQDVLRAEVAQDERSFCFRQVHRCDERVDLRFQVGVGAGGRAIIGVDAKLVEEAGIGEGAFEGRMPRRLVVDLGQDDSQLRGDRGVCGAGHQLRFPRHGVVGCAGHREEVVRAVFEFDQGHGSCGQDGAKQLEGGLLGPDAFESRVPFHGDSEALAALFDDDGGASGEIDAQDDVGNAAGQLADADLVARGDSP